MSPISGSSYLSDGDQFFSNKYNVQKKIVSVRSITDVDISPQILAVGVPFALRPTVT